MLLDYAIDILDKYLRRYMDKNMRNVGVFKNFILVSLGNVNIFIIDRDSAPPFYDIGCFIVFDHLPEDIRSWGIDCSGYAEILDNVVILLAPKEKCAGDLVIKVPTKERIPLTDPLQYSLYQMLDRADAKIEYRGKVVGILSLAPIAPIAEIVVRMVKKLFKNRGEFEIVDDKTIVTNWRQRIEFGARPIFTNFDVSFNLLDYLRDLANKHMKIEEMEVITKALEDLEYKTLSRLLDFYIDNEIRFCKCVTIRALLRKKKELIILIGKNTQDMSEAKDLKDPVENILLTLISKAPFAYMNGKKLDRDKIKVEQVKDTKSEILRKIAREITYTLGYPLVYLKIHAKKVKGDAFKAESNRTAIIGIIT